MSRQIDENAIIKMLNTMDRYTSEELTLCDTDKTFPKNEVFIVDDVFEGLDELPSAQPQRKNGKWILVKGSNGKDYHKCSECLHTQEITGVKNYCAVCGAEMREPEDIPMEYFESGGR